MFFQCGLGAAVKVAGEVDGVEDLDQPEPFPNSMVHPTFSSLRGSLPIPDLRPDGVRMYTVKIVESENRRPRRTITSIPHEILERGGQLAPRIRVTLARLPQLLLNLKLRNRQLVLFTQMFHRILLLGSENRVGKLPRRMHQALVPCQSNELARFRHHTPTRYFVSKRVRTYLVTLSRYLTERIPVDKPEPVNLLPHKPGNHIEDPAKKHYTESFIEAMSMALPAIVNGQSNNGSYVQIKRQPVAILARNSRSHLLH